MNLIDREDFEAWLRERNYAERTIQDTVMAADGLLERAIAGEDLPVNAWPRALRMVRYAEEKELPWADNLSLRALASKETMNVAQREANKRKLEAKSFDDASWRRLADAIMANESREARVLELILFSGLRIADVLRIKRTAALEALETNRLETTIKGGTLRTLVLDGPADPLYVALQRALALWASEEDNRRRRAADIATWVVVGSEARLPIDSARKASYRLLRVLGKEVGLKGRIHLHRMRRTVAVQALRSGADIVAVGQLLGQKPGSPATMRYLDEARLDDVAGIRKKVHDRFLK